MIFTQLLMNVEVYMVNLKYTIVEDDLPEPSDVIVYEKVFENSGDMRIWLQSQGGHPFLSIKILAISE